MTEEYRHVPKPEVSEQLPDDGTIIRLTEKDARAFVVALNDPPSPPDWLRRAAAEFLRKTGRR